jgi:hypothetical protein
LSNLPSETNPLNLTYNIEQKLPENNFIGVLNLIKEYPLYGNDFDDFVKSQLNSLKNC